MEAACDGSRDLSEVPVFEPSVAWSMEMVRRVNGETGRKPGVVGKHKRRFRFHEPAAWAELYALIRDELGRAYRDRLSRVYGGSGCGRHCEQTRSGNAVVGELQVIGLHHIPGAVAFEAVSSCDVVRTCALSDAM